MINVNRLKSYDDFDHSDITLTILVLRFCHAASICIYDVHRLKIASVAAVNQWDRCNGFKRSFFNSEFLGEKRKEGKKRELADAKNRRKQQNEQVPCACNHGNESMEQLSITRHHQKPLWSIFHAALTRFLVYESWTKRRFAKFRSTSNVLLK